MRTLIVLGLILMGCSSSTQSSNNESLDSGSCNNLSSGHYTLDVSKLAVCAMATNMDPPKVCIEDFNGGPASMYQDLTDPNCDNCGIVLNCDGTATIINGPCDWQTTWHK